MSYNKRTWLNSESSHYTGSIVCHDGVVSNHGKPPERYSFVEISDCHGKSRIHLDKNLTMEDYINKLRLVIRDLSEYIDHLENFKEFD